MSGVNWLSHAALSGWVVAGIFSGIVAAQWNVSSGEPRQSAQRNVSTPQIHADYQPSCEAPESREESELCAQWRAAELADRSAELAWWQNVIGGAGFGAVVLALILSALATKAARDQLRLSRHALVDTDRAFVYPKHGVWAARKNVESELIEGWSVSQRWRNSGKTPTRYLRMFINKDVRDTVLPTNFDFPDSGSETVPILIAPDGTLDSSELVLSLDEMRDIIAGRKHFYTWGWVEYDDVFERAPRHRTEFCYKWTIGGEPTNHERISMRYHLHNRHNGADDECLRPIKTSSPKNLLPEAT